jgi:hypothetical protein
VFKLVSLVIVVGVIVLLAQALGILDLSALRDLSPSLSIDQTSGEAAQPTPSSPTPSPAAARPSPTAPTAGETCTAERPRFVHGLAALKAAVGTDMGEPLECERVIDAEGDTEQRTTTGLSYYRTATNTVAFTNGWDHWALTGNGALHWTGRKLESPRPVQSPYGSRTAPSLPLATTTNEVLAFYKQIRRRYPDHLRIWSTTICRCTGHR